MDLDSPSAPHALLAIYLNDHRAAADAGQGLAARSQASNQGTPLGNYLGEFLRELDEDADIVDRLCGELGVRNDWPKRWAARLGQQLGVLKLNGQVFGYSPLSRVVELEALIAAVTAKRQLWEAVLTNKTSRPVAIAMTSDIDAARQRAERQLDRLAEHHRDAVREAFDDG